jgi:hypothetical protein
MKNVYGLRDAMRVVESACDEGEITIIGHGAMPSAPEMLVKCAEFLVNKMGADVRLLAVVNDAVMQFFNRRFPGKDVFYQFTRMKSVMLRSARPDLPWRYLPLGKVMNWILEHLVKWSV